MINLQTKAEKYASKAAQCEEQGRRAPNEPQRAFYEVLARYYGMLATDFRRVIEIRKGHITEPLDDQAVPANMNDSGVV